MSPAPSPRPYGADRIPLFLNPGSGSAERALGAAETGTRFDVHVVEGGVLRAEIRRALDSGVTRVTVVGGDGTVAAAAAELAGTTVELAVVPGGTLNHFARDHGIPGDIGGALHLAATGTARAVDVGAVNDRVFINTSSIGAYVTFVRLRDRLERWLGYRAASVLAALGTTVRVRSFPAGLEAGDVRGSYETPLVFVGVGERALAPPELGARVPGGRRGLHVMVVGRRHARRWERAYDRTVHSRGRPVRAWAEVLAADYLVDRCRLDLSRARPRIATDGEVRPAATPLDYRLWRDALRVVTRAATG